MRSLTALLLAAAAFAADAADLPATTSVRAEAIRSHVEFLASDLLEGRAAATRGYDIAAAYVAAQFRQAGLAPAGDDRHVPADRAAAGSDAGAARLRRETGARRRYIHVRVRHALPALRGLPLGQLDADRTAGVRRLRRRRARARLHRLREHRSQRPHRRRSSAARRRSFRTRSARTTRGTSASGARSWSAAPSAQSPSLRRSTASACRGSAWSR